MTDVSQAQRDWTAIIGAKLYPASVKLSDALYESADWSTVPPAYRPLPVEVEDLGAPIANALAWSLASDELKGIRDKPAEDPRDEADAVATIVLPRITMPASGTTAYAAWGTAARPMTKALWVKLREYLDANSPDLA
ncbi:MAG: hypothetical protein WCF24_00095 [Acidimicrobiales bacterium]